VELEERFIGKKMALIGGGMNSEKVSKEDSIFSFSFTPVSPLPSLLKSHHFSLKNKRMDLKQHEVQDMATR